VYSLLGTMNQEKVIIAVESMMKKFDADKEVISRDVQNVINQLISIGALNV